MSCLGEGEQQFHSFDMRQFAQLMNAISRGFLREESAEEFESQGLLLEKQRQIANYLNDNPGKWDEANVLTIALILKSLGSTRLHSELGAVARPAVTRLESLHGAEAFRSVNLETIGTLCVGLLPLVQSNDLRRFRTATLSLLNSFQQEVERKTSSYLESRADEKGKKAVASEGEEKWSSRRPALSIYQILKTYSRVQRMWNPKNITADAGTTETGLGAAARRGERIYAGCGFIKASIAGEMGVLKKTDQGNDLPAISADKLFNLPAQALQHYGRNPEVGKEVRQKQEEQLSHLKAAQQASLLNMETLAEKEELFRFLSARGIQR